MIAGSITILLTALGLVLVMMRGAPRASAATVTMMSDLKNLAMYQGYMKDSSGRYTSSFEALNYRLSEGVTAPRITLTPDGYTIALGYEGSPLQCVIYVGSTPIAPATRPETPACTDPD